MTKEKRQINFRASDLTRQQLDQLVQWWGTSQTETLTVLIDRAYIQEAKKREQAKDLRNLQVQAGQESESN